MTPDLQFLKGDAEALVQPPAHRLGLLRRPLHLDRGSGPRVADLQAGGLALLGPLPALPLPAHVHLVHRRHLHDVGAYSGKV